MKMKMLLSRTIALILSIATFVPLATMDAYAGNAGIKYSLDDTSEEIITIAMVDLENPESEFSVQGGSASVKLNASLPAGHRMRISLGKMSAYQEATITVTWTPSSYPIYMGVCESTASGLSVKKRTGGSATLTATPTFDGDFCFVMYNASATQDLTITSISYKIK